MLVNVWKTVEVEVECDIKLDEVLNEFWTQLEATEEDFRWRRMLPIIDTCTKLLAEIPDELIAKFPDEAHTEIHNRLNVQLGRYGIKTETTADDGGENDR